MGKEMGEEHPAGENSVEPDGFQQLKKSCGSDWLKGLGPGELTMLKADPQDSAFCMRPPCEAVMEHSVQREEWEKRAEGTGGVAGAGTQLSAVGGPAGFT